jgi:hypothetical protein
MLKTAIAVPLASAIVLVLSLMMPAKAQTTFECGNSFVILPDGGCLNLSHLGYLGHSRENLANIEQTYQTQFNANVELEILYNRYPAFVSETEQERQRRYESLVETSIVRDEIAGSAQQIEDRLFPLQNRAMTIFGSAFQGDRLE